MTPLLDAAVAAFEDGRGGTVQAVLRAVFSDPAFIEGAERVVYATLNECECLRGVDFEGPSQDCPVHGDMYAAPYAVVAALAAELVG